MTQAPEPSEGHEFFAPYASFATTLRTWLVAYGIGAPILMATQPSLTALFGRPAEALWVVVPFLAGVLLQVLSALIYKYAMWYLYFAELHGDFKAKKRYRASYWLSEQIWLEGGVDLLSIGMFALATVRVLCVYAGTGR